MMVDGEPTEGGAVAVMGGDGTSRRSKTRPSPARPGGSDDGLQLLDVVVKPDRDSRSWWGPAPRGRRGAALPASGPSSTWAKESPALTTLVATEAGGGADLG